MNDHQPLIERLEALVEHDNQPDWKDVVRRAEAPADATEPARARRSTRSYLARRLAPVLVFVAAALTIGLIEPWQHGPSFTERALGAVGNGPVIHAVLQDETGNTNIDLATGRETPLLRNLEIWYDSQRLFEHTRISIDGRLTSDILETPTGFQSNDSRTTEPLEPKLDVALAEFVDGYRSALESGDAQTVGSGTVNGESVTWIEFKLGSGQTERVAVGEESALPVRVESFLHGTPGWSYDIVSLETLPAGGGDFTPPSEKRALVYDSMRDHIRSISLSDAVETLPGTVWTGESISGLALSEISRVTLTTHYKAESGLAPLVGTGIELRYGEGLPFSTNKKPGGSFVWLNEAARPEPIYDWSDAAVPPARSVLASCATPPREPLRANELIMNGCRGLLIENGVYVQIQASSRELLLTAARALRPIQP